uniref:CEA cell adhesion molecule 19 n=1 Tax=Ailuropoda melanoleuca TaxID=9646 RepID=A0A7N5K8D5_AILME
METPERAQCHFSKASVLALWIPQGSWAALRIQKIPEHPQKDENLLLSVQGIPGAFQDFNWYLGEETNGGAMLFTYFPDLQRPQRDGSDMGQRDIVGFPNGSMLLHRVQPTDSGTYQVAVTINPDWTMRAKTEVRVAGGHPQRSQRPAPITMLVTPPLSSASGDQNIYEVMPSPTFPVSPPGDTGSMSTSMPLPQQQPEPENHPTRCGAGAREGS